jgi:hypothetical protein
VVRYSISPDGRESGKRSMGDNGWCSPFNWLGQSFPGINNYLVVMEKMMVIDLILTLLIGLGIPITLIALIFWTDNITKNKKG